MPAENFVRNHLSWRGGALSVLQREGPAPIVFLHGLCGGAVHYDDAFSATELMGRGLTAVDLPGFGESQGNDENEVGIEAQGEACRAVFASLGSDELPALVAHSMAGSVASRLLNDISTLVLLEGNMVKENLEFSDKILSTPPENFEQEYARMRESADVIFRLRTNVSDAARRKRYAATFRSCSAKTVRSVAEEANSDVRNDKISKRLAAWGRRFYYYVGGKSDFDTSGISANGLDVVVRKISGARHFLMLDNPAETYAAIANDTI